MNEINFKKHTQSVRVGIQNVYKECFEYPDEIKCGQFNVVNIGLHPGKVDYCELKLEDMPEDFTSEKEKFAEYLEHYRNDVNKQKSKQATWEASSEI